MVNTETWQTCICFVLKFAFPQLQLIGSISITEVCSQSGQSIFHIIKATQSRKRSVTQGNLKCVHRMRWVVLLSLSEFELLKPFDSEDRGSRDQGGHKYLVRPGEDISSLSYKVVLHNGNKHGCLLTLLLFGLRTFFIQ